MNLDITKDLLRSNAYWVLNKSIVKQYGIEVALLLTVLSEAEAMFADEDGWFFQTGPAIEELTGLTIYQQDRHFKVLKEGGLLLQENKGMPMKRHFKLNYQNILESASKKLEPLPTKNLKASLRKTSNNKTSNNKASITSSKELGPAKTPPTNTQGLFSGAVDKKTKKAQEIMTMKGMLNTFSQSSKVLKVLNDYFNLRLKKGLIPAQWQIILADLKSFCGDNENLMVEKVNGAIAGGYMQIIATWEKPVGGTATKGKFDNTAGHTPTAYSRMTAAEKEEFDDDLARDSNGKPLTF